MTPESKATIERLKKYYARDVPFDLAVRGDSEVTGLPAAAMVALPVLIEVVEAADKIAGHLQELLDEMVSAGSEPDNDVKAFRAALAKLATMKGKGDERI